MLTWITRRVLSAWQIFFITMSAVIGTGLFSHDGLALGVAGPGGVILATGIIGIIALCLMDGVSELIQAFPTPNAMVAYVRFFVDPELATCVGLIYWALWSLSFSLQLGAAADFCSAWSLKASTVDILLRVFLWFLFTPIVLICVNLCPVDVFGWIETIGGLAKLIIISALTLLLYSLAGLREGLHSQVLPGSGTVQFENDPLNDGLTRSSYFPVVGSNFLAVLTVTAFAWIGIEVVAVSAFEARNINQLRMAASRLPWVALTIYVVAAVGSGLAIPSGNSALEQIYPHESTPNSSTISATQQASPLSSSSSLIIIAANQVGMYMMAHVFNGFLVYSAISTANTCLYVASRTLYGVAYQHEASMKALRKWLILAPGGVPVTAVVVSALAFLWVPFLSLRDIPPSLADHSKDMRPVNDGSQQFLNMVCSLCTLFVWGTQCFAYTRYYSWLRLNRRDLETDPRLHRLNRWSRKKVRGRPVTLLGRFQPCVAYAGLLGCSLLLLVFPSTILWDDNADKSASELAFEVFQNFLALLAILCLWVSLKLWSAFRKGEPIKSIRWRFIDLRNSGKVRDDVERLLELCEDSPSAEQSCQVDPAELAPIPPRKHSQDDTLYRRRSIQVTEVGLEN